MSALDHIKKALKDLSGFTERKSVTLVLLSLCVGYLYLEELKENGFNRAIMFVAALILLPLSLVIPRLLVNYLKGKYFDKTNAQSKDGKRLTIFALIYLVAVFTIWIYSANMRATFLLPFLGLLWLGCILIEEGARFFWKRYFLKTKLNNDNAQRH